MPPSGLRPQLGTHAGQDSVPQRLPIVDGVDSLAAGWPGRNKPREFSTIGLSTAPSTTGDATIGGGLMPSTASPARIVPSPTPQANSAAHTISGNALRTVR